MYKHKINPVRGTCMRYDCENYDGIVGMNDLCYTLAANFSGNNSTYDSDPHLTNMCKNLVEKRRWEVYGEGRCDRQVPYQPVVWEQIKPYFPQLLERGFSPEDSLSKCMELCKTQTNLVDECQERCVDSYNCVEPGTPQAVPKGVPKGVPNGVKADPPPAKSSSSSNTVLYIFLGVFGLIVIGILVLKFMPVG